MKSFKLMATVAVAIVLCATELGFADNLTPDPAGSYANASGEVTTKYSKNIYWEPDPTDPHNKRKIVEYGSATRFNVAGLPPRLNFALISYSNFGTIILAKFQPDAGGNYVGQAGFATTEGPIRGQFYGVWLCDVNSNTGEWTPVLPVLTSDPDLSGWW